MRALMLLLALAVGATEAGERPSLRIIIPGAPGGRPVVGFPPIHLRVWARLDDPGREWACPSWEWAWTADDPLGEVSTTEVTSCDPFAMDQPALHRSADMRQVYRTPGKHRIEVRVRAQGREKRTSREVIVLGGPETMEARR